MFKQRCPHCGVKLGNYLYADACPHCRELLEHNQADQTPVQVEVARPKSLSIRAFSRLMRFVES